MAVSTTQDKITARDRYGLITASFRLLKVHVSPKSKSATLEEFNTS